MAQDAPRLVLIMTMVGTLASCEHKVDPAPKPVEPPPPASPPAQPARNEPEAPGTPAVAYEGPCPVGMTLVDGGSFTGAQQTTLVERFEGAGKHPDLPFEIAPFCLAVHETTRAEFHECIVAGACLPDRDFQVSIGPGPQPCMSAEDECPLDIGRLPVWRAKVDGARAYCAFRGGRLPLFGEWLWAATGGEEARPYPWGSEPPTVAHLNVCDERCLRAQCCGDVPEDTPLKSCAEPSCLRESNPLVQGDDGHAFLAPVGSYPRGAGRWGHLDLLGNTKELLELVHREYTCGGDAHSQADVLLDLNRHECVQFQFPARAFGGVRCAADPRP